MSNEAIDCKHDGATVCGSHLRWCDQCGEVIGKALPLIDTAGAAELLGFSTESIRRMCEAGKFAGAFRPNAGGQWRIPRGAVVELLDQARAVKRRRMRRRA